MPPPTKISDFKSQIVMLQYSHNILVTATLESVNLSFYPNGFENPTLKPKYLPPFDLTDK